MFFNKSSCLISIQALYDYKIEVKVVYKDIVRDFNSSIVRL